MYLYVHEKIYYNSKLIQLLKYMIYCPPDIPQKSLGVDPHPLLITFRVKNPQVSNRKKQKKHRISQLLIFNHIAGNFILG